MSCTMQLGNSLPRQCRYHAPAASAASRPVRTLQCFAKRKGEQKNEGMYFTYEKVSKQDSGAGDKPKPNDSQKQDFGWVSSARSSVQQYRQPPHRKPNKQKQQQGSSKAAPAAATAALQPNQALNAQGGTNAQGPAAAAAGAGLTATSSKQLTAAAAAPAEISAAVKQQQQHDQPPPAAAAQPAAAGASEQQDIQQQQPVASTAAHHSRTSDDLPAPTTTRAAAHNSSSSNSSRIRSNDVTKRKQQLLQRMKGAAPAAAVAAAEGSPTDPVTPAAAAASLAASATAAGTAAAAAAATYESTALPGLDAEGQLLLQELLDMAQELSHLDNNTSSNTVTDNDPMIDPLADIMPDPLAAAAFNGSSSSNGRGQIGTTDLVAAAAAAAAAAGNTEAADIFATITEMQQRMQTAAAADLDSSSMLRVADLLSWEADEAAESNKITDLDIEAELAATQQGDYGEVPSEDLDQDEWEYVEDSESENESDISYYESDPEVQQRLADDDAEFAKMLAQLDNAESSSSSTVAAEQKQEAWSGLGIQDWVEAVGDAGSTSSSDALDAAAARDDDALLPDLISEIESDRTLDDKSKLEARMRIQGMFNDPTAVAESRKRGSRSLKQQQQQQQGTADPLDAKGPTTTGAAAAAGEDEEVPTLLPRPVRPAV